MDHQATVSPSYPSFPWEVRLTHPIPLPHFPGMTDPGIQNPVDDNVRLENESPICLSVLGTDVLNKLFCAF
jgi:hypothetical protein